MPEPGQTALTDRPYDLERILAYRQVLRRLDPSGEPGVEFLTEAAARGVRNLALLPGSFNPPTIAHVALATSALDQTGIDAVAYVLGTVTVNKTVTGLSLDDRLLLLSLLVEGQPAFELAAINRGLLVDQADVVRKALPTLERLWFVVGFDKILQIFDPRYYPDRDAALSRLFSLAAFLVAPRGNAGFDDLKSLLLQPENREFANRVVPLKLPVHFRDVSSSHLRNEVTTNRRFPDVPTIVADFLEETGAYTRTEAVPGREAIDRYDWRQRLVGLIEAGEVPVSSPSEFRVLVRTVASANEHGHSLRDRLRSERLINSRSVAPGRAT